MNLFRNCIIIQSLLFQSILNSAIIELPDLVRESDQLISVAFFCNDSRFEKLGQFAFDIHGAYDLEQSKPAEFTVQMAILNDASFGLRILNGEAVIHESKSKKGDSYQSFLELLDKAIEITGNRKNLLGFYSGQFAFVGKRNGNSELYISDIFFQKIQQITSDNSLLTRPKWSPNGNSLLFTSYYKSGFPDLFEINLATRKRSTIAAFKGTNAGGIYSPNGSHIAMTLSNDGNSDLYTLNLNNRNLKRVTKTKALESSPSWSPDGKRLVVVSDSLGSPQLYTLDALGGTMKRIKTNISRYCSEPDWNPVNEDLIAFSASIDGCFQIAVYSFKTGKSTVLTQVKEGALQATWMPDGRHITFTERMDGSTRLVLLDTITKKSSPLHSTTFGASSGATFLLKSQ